MEDGSRPAWRQHPLLKRLPFLLLVALGLWLWQGARALERELVWRLEGPGWSQVRALDFQLQAEDGELLKRETRTFPQGAPPIVTLQAELPPGTYEVRVFLREERGASKPLPVERLTLGAEDTRVERTLRAR